MNESIFSTTYSVESPFVWVTLGGATLGMYSKKTDGRKQNIQYPNFIQSMSIKRYASAAVNVYTLNIVYAVTPEDDPNLIEKLLSISAASGRKIVVSYGDYMAYNYAHKNEEAIIIDVVPSIAIKDVTISYTITAVSNSYPLHSIKYSFNSIFAKPSDVIKGLFRDSTDKYGLKALLPGMVGEDALNKYIASDDALIQIEGENNISILDYIKKLVAQMRSSDETSGKKTSVYMLGMYDDYETNYGARQYIKITKLPNAINSVSSADILMSIDIGNIDSAANDGRVIDFNLRNSSAYSILYSYAESVGPPIIQYDIDSTGKVIAERVETYSRLRKAEKETFNTWWAQMTEFPISATIKLRGLLKTVNLMDKILMNIYYYGKKFIYSGIYVISEQDDQIDSNGYRTQLSLTRIGGVEY